MIMWCSQGTLNLVFTVVYAPVEPTTDAGCVFIRRDWNLVLEHFQYVPPPAFMFLPIDANSHVGSVRECIPEHDQADRIFGVFYPFIGFSSFERENPVVFEEEIRGIQYSL